MFSERPHARQSHPRGGSRGRFILALLRSTVAPLVLIGTVVLSFGAALGISALVFKEPVRFRGRGHGDAAEAAAVTTAN